MNKFWQIFTKKVEVLVYKPSPVPDIIIFNVDNFNNWFNLKDNNAEYAHPGIFLRLDKLTPNHIHDYIDKCYGIDCSEEYQKTLEFYDEIRKDWREKIKAKDYENKIRRKIR